MDEKSTAKPDDGKPLIDFSEVAKEDAPTTPATAGGSDKPVSELPDDGPARGKDKGSPPSIHLLSPD